MGLGGHVSEGGANHYDWFDLTNWSDNDSEQEDSIQAHSDVFLIPSKGGVKKWAHSSQSMTRETFEPLLRNVPPLPGSSVKAKLADLIPDAIELDLDEKIDADAEGALIVPAVQVPPKPAKYRTTALHEVWAESTRKRILLVDLDNLQAKPARLKIHLTAIVYLANQADFVFLAGQERVINMAKPYLRGFQEEIKLVPFGADRADHYLIKSALEVHSAEGYDFVVSSNDHTFGQLSKHGRLTILSPRATAISHALARKAHAVLDLMALEEDALPFNANDITYNPMRGATNIQGKNHAQKKHAERQTRDSKGKHSKAKFAEKRNDSLEKSKR